MNDRGTYLFIGKVMALPFLLATEIPAMYAQLQANASTPRLQQFMEYIETIWINSTTWPPSTWSVYMKAIRTNNDIEGWHRGMASRSQSHQASHSYLSTCWSTFCTVRPGEQHFKSGWFQRESCVGFKRKNTGSCKPKSSDCGKNMKMVSIVQGNC